MRKTYKKNSNTNYQILDAYAIVHCDCGDDVYLPFYKARKCDTCDKIYDMSVDVYELIEEEKNEPGLIGVISSDPHSSNKFLENLLKKMFPGEMKETIYRSRNFLIETTLKNGDVYRAYKVNDGYIEHLRGLRFKKLYIDNRLKGESFLQHLLMGCIGNIDYFVL